MVIHGFAVIFFTGHPMLLGFSFYFLNSFARGTVIVRGSEPRVQSKFLLCTSTLHNMCTIVDILRLKARAVNYSSVR